MSASERRIVEHVIAREGEGPYAVAATDDGAVWCTLVHAGAVVRFDPGTGAVARLDLEPAGAGRAHPEPQEHPRHGHPAAGAQPSQLAAADESSVWVTDTTGNRVLLLGVDASGTPVVKLEVAVPTADAQPFGIAAMHDGTVWFTELGQDALGRIDILGQVTEFPAGTHEGFVSMIAASGDSLWFTANQTGAIGYIRGGDAAVQLFPIPTPHAGPVGITVGDDGAAWFCEIHAGAIGRVDRAGRFSEHPLPWSESKPHAICRDGQAGGGLWATLWGSNQLAHIALDGAIDVVDLPGGQSEPHGLAVAADGTVWVAMESGALCSLHAAAPAA